MRDLIKLITPLPLFLQYANTYGSWGWKTPPMALVMTDQFGNKMQARKRGDILNGL